MLTRMNLPLMRDLAEVDAIAQQVVERATAEGLSPTNIPLAGLPALAGNTALVEFAHQLTDRAKSQESLEDTVQNVGLGFIDGELAIEDVVAERREAAHPHSFFLRGRA